MCSGLTPIIASSRRPRRLPPQSTGCQALREAVSGPQAAAAFKVLEAAIAKSVQPALPKPGNDVPAGGNAAGQAEIDKLMAEKDANGKQRYFTDPKFRAEIEKKRVALFTLK